MPHVRAHLVRDFKLPSGVSTVLAWLFQAAATSFYHLAVYGAGTGELFGTFVFALIAGAGVYAFRSIGFEYGAHTVINLLKFFGVTT